MKNSGCAEGNRKGGLEAAQGRRKCPQRPEANGRCQPGENDGRGELYRESTKRKGNIDSVEENESKGKGKETSTQGRQERLLDEREEKGPAGISDALQARHLSNARREGCVKGIEPSKEGSRRHQSSSNPDHDSDRRIKATELFIILVFPDCRQLEVIALEGKDVDIVKFRVIEAEIDLSLIHI